MPKLNFRLMSIMLDVDEEVAAVTAMATEDAARVIAGLGTTDLQSGHVGQDGRRLVTLSRPVIEKLHDATGKINGLDPRHEITTEIYDSLCIVVNGLMEDW